MKNQTIQLGLLLAMILGITACEKNEQVPDKISSDLQSAKLANFVPTKVRNSMGAYFEAVDTICEPYLKYTRKINVSDLPDGYVFTLTDGNLTLSTLGDLGLFTKNLLPRIPGGPTGIKRLM